MKVETNSEGKDKSKPREASGESHRDVLKLSALQRPGWVVDKALKVKVAP
jgi:hypothetical protein